ncbi:EamA family transporter [Amycolatopsis rhabdoformis]|uniref:EamA family transporter n=1 Tax=Amycolatopsis rhabdoformis TaxID=1448059 RepID=A0ABZ1IF00_9PSEU|nr:EamA family transporter [Amycolatopsis rhabdoformis]WSE32676.1 EamA family transporter [Amycolatopsis rhabdoformis]
MGVLLGLLSALSYGASDFVAGVGGRRGDPNAVTVLAQPWSLLAALLAVLVMGPRAPHAGELAWGAVSGLGTAVGTFSLYRGLATARMSVVAPVSAVLAAALPALVGFATGDRLTWLSWLGIVLVLPAIALVSQHSGDDAGRTRSGVVEGITAGAGFGVLFIGLDRAGTGAGSWPLVAGQAVGVVLLLLAVIWLRPATWARAWWPATAAGVLGGAANLLFVAATGAGQLAVVAVITSLYPAITIVLARGVLHERWSRKQAAGLVIAAAGVAAITLGQP